AAATHKGITGTETISAREALRGLIERLDLKGRIAEQRAAMREGAAIRRELSAAAKDLPAEIRSRMLSPIANAKNADDLSAGLKRIDALLEEVELRNLRSQVKD